MHFFGIGWTEVQQMPFSEFTRLVKCANMISARDRLIDIKVANFASLKKEAQEEFQRGLKGMSDRWIFKPLKPLHEVAANLAKGLMRGR